MLIVEDSTVSVKCKTAMKTIFFTLMYVQVYNWCSRRI